MTILNETQRKNLNKVIIFYILLLIFSSQLENQNLYNLLSNILLIIIKAIFILFVIGVIIYYIKLKSIELKEFKQRLDQSKTSLRQKHNQENKIKDKY